MTNMAIIPFSSLTTLYPCFILLLISCIITIPSEGLKMTLVHPHSQDSPAYLGNLTISKKIRKLVKQSRGRAKVLSRRLFPTKNLNQNSTYGESKIIPRPPIDGNIIDDNGGYVYAVKIGIGRFNEESLYKTYYLTLDTVSTLMWLQCEACQTAGNTCFPQVDPIYQNSLSQTYGPLTEDDDMCVSAPSNPNPNNLCYYNKEFADGSKSSGQIAYEDFSLESDSPDTVVCQLAFGCGFNQRDFAVDPNGPEQTAVQLDGYSTLGLNFSYCFQDLLNLGGSPQGPTYLRFTGDIPYDPSTFQETAFQVMPCSTYYYVRLIGSKIDDTPVNMSPLHYVILDSGSSISYLRRAVYDSLQLTLLNWVTDRLGRPPRMLQANDLTNPPTFCFEKGPKEGYNILPTIHFMLEGDGDFEIQPQQGFALWQLWQDQGRANFCLMIEPHDSLSIIGAFQQAKHRPLYDSQQNKLLFKNEDCANNP